MMTPMQKSFAAVVLIAAGLAVLSAQSGKPAPAASRAPFSVVEASIPEMRSAMEQGRVTSQELVRQYLMRIGQWKHRCC